MRNDWTHLLTAMFNVALIAAGVGAFAYLIVEALNRSGAYE